MKTISVRAWRDKTHEIQNLADERLTELATTEYVVVTMEEDIEDELLRLCRGHAEYLCGGRKADPFFLWDWDHKGFTVEWQEAGEQVYAQWRGWV